MNKHILAEHRHVCIKDIIFGPDCFAENFFKKKPEAPIKNMSEITLPTRIQT